jgi:malate dehydrogenase (oxaloacetate-decarboxylating)(NADP+)
MNDDQSGSSLDQEALDYHAKPAPGKFEIAPTKPLSSQRDLSLAYTPGVAAPCEQILDNPKKAFDYTNRKNLVGVVTNGTATLGLGDTGPLASKPVMEGKALLFKHLAGVDAFDIELDTDSTDSFVNSVRALEPTFGAINLEDISAPECFEIEERLCDELDIPVFHDDQHGTAIITGAALLNALELQGKRLEDVRIVFAGAGAAGIACARLYQTLGATPDNILMCDEYGVIYKGRDKGMHAYMRPFARETELRTLEEAMKGADVFIGVSVGGIVSKQMVRSMAERPIIFALANPEPEISYPDAMDARGDLIMATGRSDYPNQVNNVMGYPYIFRGALDVSATDINDEMKIAAVKGLAELAKQDIPEEVSDAYDADYFTFGPDYILPKPFDPRALLHIAPAVAKAAVETGVARQSEKKLDEYAEQLERMQCPSKGLIGKLINKAKQSETEIVFPDGEAEDILRAAHRLLDEGIAKPILMGRPEVISRKAKHLELELGEATLFDHHTDPKRQDTIERFYEMRQRKGVTLPEAEGVMKHRPYYAMMMLNEQRADAVVSGLQASYAESIRPALEIIGVSQGVQRASGAYIAVTESGVKFFADTTVNIAPSPQTLAEIAINTAELAKTFDIEPRVAMLSYSNFGNSGHERATDVAEATRIVKQRRSDIEVDGEMQVGVALDEKLRRETFDFAELTDDANILIFPNLDAGNIAYKLVDHLGDAELIGPVLLGMNKPVNILQRACGVTSVVNLAVITALRAQSSA